MDSFALGVSISQSDLTDIVALGSSTTCAGRLGGMDDLGGNLMKIQACRSQNAAWPTILCIDDDPQISETIGLRLNQYDVNVISACHGMHGFWLAMTNRPELVITDVNMPQGAGDYVVGCLRRNSDTHEIPIIVLTGQRDSQLEIRMRHCGADEYFIKPVYFDKLRDAILKYIPLKERNWNEVMTMARRT